MIKREIYPKAQKLLKNKEILVLIGARQVGKTTLMTQLFKEEKRKKIFLTFDKQEDLFLFENNVEAFIKKYVLRNEIIFIDEFQYAKEGGKLLKYIYDTHDIKIVLSGSSVPELTIQSLSYLVGRYRLLPIHPLTFKEFIQYKDKSLLSLLSSIDNSTLPYFKLLFEEFLLFGAMPRIVTEKEVEYKKELLDDIKNSYLVKEIKEVLGFTNNYEFEKVISILAVSDSTILNKTNISNDTGIYFKKISEIIHILEQTFLLHVLQPFEDSKIKELLKSPKTYFFDLGLKNSIIKVFSDIYLRVDKGAIYENFILQEFKKKNINLQFYNYKNSSEVDFLYTKDNQVIAIEVKSKLNGKKLTRGLIEYLKKYKPSQVFIFNENIIGEDEFEGIPVYFKHYISVFELLEK